MKNLAGPRKLAARSLLTAALMMVNSLPSVAHDNGDPATDELDHFKLSRALEINRTRQRSHWKNPLSGVSYEVIPTRTFQTLTGRYCRKFVIWGLVGDYETQIQGTACRMNDGGWNRVK